MSRYLVDKSALARMTHESVRRRLAPIIEAGEAATCSIVDLEVLFSARGHQDHETIRTRRDLAYDRVPLTQEIFDRAVEIQGALARRGHHRLPIPDLIVPPSQRAMARGGPGGVARRGAQGDAATRCWFQATGIAA